MNRPNDMGRALVQLVHTSVNYDLRKGSERQRSAANLQTLLIDLTAASHRPVFLECGAKDADLSRRMREKVPHCEVIAFEANPRAFETFKAQHDFEAAGVDYRNVALADADGRIPFRLYKTIGDKEIGETEGRHSLLVRQGENTYEEFDVEARTLDGLFKDWPDRRLSVLIDVEGATHLVLAGATDLLRRTDVLVVEVETRAYWEGQWLVEHVVQFMGENGMYPVARDFEFHRQYNILFVREDALNTGPVLVNLERYLQRAAFGGTR